MTEIVLTITILFLIVALATTNYISTQEREKLLKMLMARDLKELTDNEYIEKQKPAEPSKPPDLIEMGEEDETVFTKAIKTALKSEEES